MSRSSENDRLVDIALDLRHETDKAFLVSSGGSEQVWLPKSLTENADNVKVNGSGVFVAPYWLLHDKGLI